MMTGPLFNLLLALATSAVYGDLADQVRSTGLTGGVVVHLNCGEGTETAKLRLGETFLVHGLATDNADVLRAQKTLSALGQYGPVSVARFDGKQLPYVDNLINVIVSESATSVPRQEILRALAPQGVAFLGDEKIVKPRPAEIDEWHHFLRGADNNAVANDSVVSMPRSLQWVSEPRWGRSHEELASMSAAVSANGRLFYIVDEAPLASIRFGGQWKVVARDAFNGTRLWTRTIPAWSDHLRHFRAGPVHLPRRLVAVGDRVYVTLGLAAPVSALDAATGSTVHEYAGTERTEEILYDRGVLYLVLGTSEAHRRGGGLHKRSEPSPTDFRAIEAMDADTGRKRWRRQFPKGEFLLPLTLAVRGENVLCQTTLGVACLDAKSGARRWLAPRPTPARRMSFSAPTLVATDGVVLCADRVASANDNKQGVAKDGLIEWGVHGWNEPNFARKGKTKLIAYSTADGRELWSVGCSEGYNSPVDVFVVGNTVWVGADFKGYDLQTGNLVKSLHWKGAPVGMAHHRCYRDKATERFLLTGRSGIELVSFEDGWLGNNSWIRGTCQYGIMPCNGLLYAPPDACACFNKVKLAGFFAAAPQRGEDGHLLFAESPALEKGPAYGQVEKPQSTIDNRLDWPTYRHDGARSGVSATGVPSSLEQKWRVRLGGKLTQPVVVGNTVYIASTDAHTVYALAAAGGKAKWQFIAGGRIDSAPTIYAGRVLFGCADGWIYCLRAADGALAWRFRAAPEERLASVFGQLESVWPVHGAVLVQNGTLYAGAGRSTYLDGGIVLYRLDPLTGKELSRTLVYDLDPDTGKQLGREGSRGFDMEGATTDLLSGDGDSVFLKHLRFEADGKKAKPTVPHLWSLTGFLGEDWFVRSYWLVGTEAAAGWGGWARAAQTAPFGRILSVTDKQVYGYGRVTISSGPTGHRADAYHLFAMNRTDGAGAPTAAEQRRGQGKQRKPKKIFIWSQPEAPIVRALALAGDQLVLAGMPDRGRRARDLLAFENPTEALAAFEGRRGSSLCVVSAVDGATRFQCELPAPPVFDGLSTARGHVFLSLRDGTVSCWGEG